MLSIAVKSELSGGFCQESKIGVADAEGALDRFCPSRTIPRSGAHLLPIAAKSGPTCPRAVRQRLPYAEAAPFLSSSRQPTGVWRAAVAGALAGAKACVPRRRRERARRAALIKRFAPRCMCPQCAPTIPEHCFSAGQRPGRRVSRPVGRVLCARSRGPTAIHLGLPLPAASCGLPASIGRAALERSRSRPKPAF
jgi:hypothetical protein